jgi:hypothetical protein
MAALKMVGISKCIILENTHTVFEVTSTMTNLRQPAGRRPSKLTAALQNAVIRVHTFLYRSSKGAI